MQDNVARPESLRGDRGFKSRRPDYLLQMVEGKTASRVPTCVGKVAGSNPAIQTIFSDNRMTDASAYVYVLRSVNDGWYYVGCSVDPQRRLVEHNSGESKSTRARRPYELAYTERFPNLSVARKREQEIKRKKSRQYIGWLVVGRPESM